MIINSMPIRISGLVLFRLIISVPCRLLLTGLGLLFSHKYGLNQKKSFFFFFTKKKTNKPVLFKAEIN